MNALLAALIAALVPQDESRLKEAWPKIADAWKAVEAYKPAGAGSFDDEFLKVAGKIHEAFEAGGLYGSEGEYVPLALKSFVKVRAFGSFPGGAGNSYRSTAAFTEFNRAYGNSPGGSAASMGALLEALAKLRNLEKSGFPDEELVMDELVTVRKALKGLAITSDATPGPLRRRTLALVRALALGEPYPEPAAATEEQAKRYRQWVSELGHEEIEKRDTAMKELLRASDACLPMVREALKSGDAEVVARARKILGFGHAPWMEAQSRGQIDRGAHMAELKLKLDAVRAEAVKGVKESEDKK